MRVFLTLWIFLITSSIAWAQTKPKDLLLFKIDKKAVYASEFEKVLLKKNHSKQAASQDIDEALNDFVNFKLKVAYAQKLNFQDLPNIQNQLKTFKEKTTDSLEVRSKLEELLVAHIHKIDIHDIVKDDAFGLQLFYNKNIEKYLTTQKIEAIVVTAYKSDNALFVKKLLDDNIDLHIIKKAVYEDLDKNNISIKKGVFESNSKDFPLEINLLTSGSEMYYQNNQFIVVKTIQKIPVRKQALEAIKEEVKDEYKHYLGELLVSNLKENYKVSISKKNFKKFKKGLVEGE